MWKPALASPLFSRYNLYMALLITLRGPEVGRRFFLDGDCTVLGRQYDSTICLTGKAISRQHARISHRDAAFFVEDLDSSNGTFLNGLRLGAHAPAPFSERDTLQIGPYVFALRLEGEAGHATEPNLVIREKVSATAWQQSLYGQDPALKLQVVLEIAQNLGRTLDLDPVLEKLLEQLLRLFPQSDRALVILYEGDKLVVRAQRCRGAHDETAIPFSRTIVREALEEGVGLLSEDVQTDRRFRASDTVTNLGLHSVLCVPLITQEGRRLGVIQLDRFRKGIPYGIEDLHLLTAISLQVAVVLENVEFHAERLREERLHQELALAREIQQGFLPAQMEKTAGGDVELFGRVFPARQVAGDLYDYFLIGGGRLAFCIGDVSGKGMPAALFMVAVRTLFRHLVKETTPPGPPFARGGGGFVSPTRSGEPAFSPPCEGGAGGGPVQVLTRLHAALADDNPACMFVTLAHGTIAPDTGQVLLASAGHPAPLLRRADGTVEAVPLPSGRLLGYEAGDLHLQEIRLTLGPGETLVFVTDGVLEARSPVAGSMFGLERLKEVIAGFDVKRCPAECADQIKTAIELFTGSKDMQDDVTVLILRRGLASASLALIPAGKKK